MKKLLIALAITGASFSVSSYELIDYNPAITASVGANAFGGVSVGASFGGIYLGHDMVEDTIHGYNGTADTTMIGYTFEGSDWNFTPLLGINKIKHHQNYANTAQRRDVSTSIYSSDAVVGLAVSYNLTKNVFIEARATHTISKHDVTVTTRYTNQKGERKYTREQLANEHFMNASISVGVKF